MPDEKTAAALASLEAVRAKRKFLLPHHGLLAICDRPLLDAYDAFYTELALKRRAFDDHDKEIVWVACLFATREPVPVQHVRNLRNAGGTDAEIAELADIAALVFGAEAYAFAASWQAAMPGFDHRATYLKRFDAATSGNKLGPRLTELSALAMHVCLGRWDEYRWHLERAYALGLPEPEIAETISVPVLPANGVNYFYHAAGMWRDMIRAGAVPASDLFKAWAAVPDDNPTAR